MRADEARCRVKRQAAISYISRRMPPQRHYPDCQKPSEPMNPIPVLMPDATSVFGLPKKVKGASVVELEEYVTMDTAKDEKLPTKVAMDTAKDEKLPTKSFDIFKMIEEDPSVLGKRQTALLEEVHAVGKQMPSTYTENGPVKNRKSPLDRVFASHKLKNSLMVVQPRVLDPQKAKALTDHVPIFIMIKINE